MTTAGPGTRRLRVVLGCLCVALGVIGIVVPGLPTTVFLLAASCLFARSSPRLERYLLQHRVLGRYLRDFAQKRGMAPRDKVTALASMWAGIGISLLFLPSHGAIRGIVLLAGLIGSSVILFHVRTARDLGA